MYLHELNSNDAHLEDEGAFVISLGSIEQHGPYGPLGTDYLVQTELIKRVERQLPNVIFLPVTPFGPCWQQLGFPGTVSLRESTLFVMITDIVDSLKYSAGIILFVSWHGDNKPVIDRFLSEKSSTYAGIHMAQITFRDEGTDAAAEQILGDPSDDHAGNTEVALMLAVNAAVTKEPNPIDEKLPNSGFQRDRKIIEVQPAA